MGLICISKPGGALPELDRGIPGIGLVYEGQMMFLLLSSVSWS
ncbi:hypothetical protein NVIE_006470 [Nitrososphaera viennensis EN76]|uniref:Uncharacterized protein n=1 Tax=Nitrososphaera viennensis EN76 TaxID=926571 RepID=A0A060HMP7_9ARCH|nr:hypothetical protein NVIE_006470 [Nitrososphaera viennensis EN76]